MTKKQMKEQLMWNVKFNAKQAREYWGKATVEGIKKGDNHYRLYKEYQARALETISILLMLQFINDDEYNELVHQTVQTSMATINEADDPKDDWMLI